MFEYFIGEIAAFIGGYFSKKTIDRSISLKKWFIISFCLCACPLIILSFMFSDNPLAWKNIILIFLGSLAFATFTYFFAKWEIKRKEKNKKI